jgi:hypothetical protein
MPKGSLLLDLPDQEYVSAHLTPESWHEANDGIVVCRRRRLEEDVVYCREMVLSRIRGLIRDLTYCTRLYSPEKIKRMLTSSGFSSIRVRKGFATRRKSGDYGVMTNRMAVIADKP